MCCAIPRTACRMRSWRRPADCTTFETRDVSGGPKPNENLIPNKVSSRPADFPGGPAPGAKYLLEVVDPDNKINEGAQGEQNNVLPLVRVKVDQTIAFGPLPSKTYGDPSSSLIGTASSGLPVSFSILSGPATLTGNVLTITRAGTVV